LMIGVIDCMWAISDFSAANVRAPYHNCHTIDYHLHRSDQYAAPPPPPPPP
jgi:hypothetical protein